LEEETLMFFFLSKTVGLLLLPSNLLVVTGLVGLALMATRYRRAGKRIAIVSLALLLTVGILPVGKLLANVLENRFPRWDETRGAPVGIIVLGGAIDAGLTFDRGSPALSDAAERVVMIGKLARQFPQARIIFSGGSGALTPGDIPEGDAVYPILDDLGVPRARVQVENRSRNTNENATFSKAMADPKPGERWLLVTSAIHMPRAVGCFRRAGFPVEAYPVDWTTATHPSLAPDFFVVAGLKRADDAVHEWTGLVAYWLSGRTDAFLPGP
jgi:uncharacterized SAM-binding protein YcdF (DUF218 family)